ncbi:MAG: hypothetical protein JWQ43_3626 [Glaciihabitans sp.]|nr:hypothetical protein [Glaciihabitans sp.]
MSTSISLIADLSLNPVLPPLVLLPVLAVMVGLVIGQIIRQRGNKLARAWVIRLAIVLLLAVVALRPTVGGSGPQSESEGGLEVYFVVDTTSSMVAEDYGSGQPRLNGVKTDIAGIARSLPDAEFGLISFDSSAVQRMPVTSDLTALRSAVTVLTQEVTTYSAGSNIDASIDLVTRVLTEAANENPDRPRVIYYFGDGEQTAVAEPRSFADIAGLVDGGAVLGYGTETGGPMMSYDGYSDEQSVPTRIMDYTTTPPSVAISRIDEGRLQTIAEQLGVGYEHRDEGDPVTDLVAGINVPPASRDAVPAGIPLELYWIFAIPLALLLVRELVGTATALRDIRPVRREAR